MRTGWQPTPRTSPPSRARASPPGGTSRMRRPARCSTSSSRSAPTTSTATSSAARAGCSAAARETAARRTLSGDRARAAESGRPLHRRRRPHLRPLRSGAGVRRGDAGPRRWPRHPARARDLGAALNAFGDTEEAAQHILRHFDLIYHPAPADSAAPRPLVADTELRPGRDLRDPDRRDRRRDDLDRTEQPRLLGFHRRPARARRVPR